LASVLKLLAAERIGAAVPVDPRVRGEGLGYLTPTVDPRVRGGAHSAVKAR